MFRPVRRTKREISIEAAKALLTEARIGVFAVNGDEGYPFAIPVNYFYDEENQKIYFHGARAGHKVDSLKKSDKVCFTVYGPEVVKKEEWAPFVKSAVVFGRCHIMEDHAEALVQLRKLAQKYFPTEDLITEEIEKDGHAVNMFEIEIEHLTGKEIQEK